MKASDLFVQALEQEGVEFIFGLPGEENLDLLDSVSRSSIRLILTRHEQAAGFMAATYGRLTGRAGVCLSTLGPGATNLVTAAAFAQLGAMPMVMITGQKPIKTSKQGRFQIVDTIDMMTPLTKFCEQIIAGDRIPSLVREAFRRAEEERPGATHLELPEDIAVEETDAPLLTSSQTRRPIAETKAIALAVELLETARRPLLFVGAAANRKLTCRMLRQFVEKTGIPFFTTQMGKGVIHELDERCLGCAALSSGDYVHRAIDAADVIINVGHDVVEKPPFIMRPNRHRVIHVDFTSAMVDPVYFPQVEVVGNIANSVWQIKERLEPPPYWDFGFYRLVRQALTDDFDAAIEESSFPLKPWRLVADVRRAMPDRAIVALDNGMYKIWFARNYRSGQPNTLLLDNALATMGAGLPSAIAAKLVRPDRPVAAVCGDGGFMMNSQELETAVRLNLDLVILLLRDNGLGMIKWKQSHMGLADYGLSFGNPDFVEYAASYGAKGRRVHRCEELIPAIKECTAQGGVQLIEVPIDYSDDERILHEEIPARSQALTGDSG